MPAVCPPAGADAGSAPGVLSIRCRLGEMRTTRARPPLVLIVDDHEWSRRSLEGMLAPNGFATMRAYTGKKGLARARAHLPDVLCLSFDLPDMDSLELCHTLRSDPLIGTRTPIVMTSIERVTRNRRLAAHRAGAWHVLTFPVDAEELVLRTATLLRAKFEGDRLRDAGLMDAATGLYNPDGLEERVRELGACAARRDDALACITVAPSVGGAESDAARTAIADTVARALKAVARVSDVVGRLGTSEFAVLAAGTSAEGAVRLAERIAAAVQSALAAERHLAPIEVRAGFDAVANVRETPARARELLLNANAALRRAQTSQGPWLRAFEAAPPADV